MVNDSQNKTIASSETVPFNISNLSTLQYVKIIFIDTNNELLEIQTNVNNIDDDTIQLYIHRKEDFNITCPVGVALKLVTSDAIYFEQY